MDFDSENKKALSGFCVAYCMKWHAYIKFLRSKKQAVLDYYYFDLHCEKENRARSFS